MVECRRTWLDVDNNKMLAHYIFIVRLAAVVGPSVCPTRLLHTHHVSLSPYNRVINIAGYKQNVPQSPTLYSVRDYPHLLPFLVEVTSRHSRPENLF